MRRTGLKMATTLAAAISIMSAATMDADEGMWLFTDPPAALLKERYGFEPGGAWLEHVRKSSVRFNSGGSGSFVSSEGLVMSNHHVGADAIQKLGTAEKNYMRDGFHARTREEELRCHDLELNVLMSIADVTDEVQAAVKPEMAPAEAFAARRAVMAGIEKKSMDETGLRSDVVTLFQGGKYHLYRFKKYTDVRLVFAPEQQIAFYGGDPDNFEFPRYCLDFCFFRAYEEGKPARIEHYLKWNDDGPAENELVFVSGHPGATSRQLTMEELEYKRDVQFPNLMDRLHRLEVMLNVYSGQSHENARRAKDKLFGVQNSRKAREGGLAGLLDPALMAKKRAQEERLKAAMQASDKHRPALAAYHRIASAQRIIRENALRYNLIEGGSGFYSRYFDVARTLLRSAAERNKPNGERLREFRESARESLELELFSDEPVYDDLEQVQLADSLTYLIAKLGFNDPLVQQVLAGQSPQDRASELVLGTTVKEVAQRKKLYAETVESISQSQDPMIRLALLLDEEARAMRKTIEAQDEIKRQAYSEIAAAKFALEGAGSYPDATFTLRLAFGTAKGYEEGGTRVPFQTTFEGLYQRAASHDFLPPFDLPARWRERKEKLDLSTPFNFVTTADIIGGNSGSPTINRKGEVVGLIFDGNIHSLVLDFVYSDSKARALSVHTRAITESLRKVYDAPGLARELTGRD